MCCQQANTGGWFNIKTTSCQYRKSHCGDKAILRPSYFHNGISYTGNMSSLYWIKALVVMFPNMYIHCRLHSISENKYSHYNDVIMTTVASQITGLTFVYSTVYSDTDQRKHQSSASLAFVWEIHRDRWIPRTKGQLRGKCFHLMTSSWAFRGSIYTKCQNMTIRPYQKWNTWAQWGRLLLVLEMQYCLTPDQWSGF